jgi:hypothetical protein
MNFLGIKQFLAIIFTLKINFSISFLVISNIWTARVIKPKARASAQRFLRHTTVTMDGGLIPQFARVS